MLESVEYGNSRIEFSIKRSDRKTVGISVLPCGTVEVSAPNDAPSEKIYELVLKRGAWLLEQLRFCETHPTPLPPKSFVSGESFFLIGKHYRLKIFESNYDSVELLDDRIILNCTYPRDVELKRKLLNNWYIRKADTFLSARFKHLAKQYDQEGIRVVIKKLPKRWANLDSSQNLILLNAELITAPIECIDYVITHELCRLSTPKSDLNFEILMDRRLPGWTNFKIELGKYSMGFEPFFAKL